MDSETLYNVLAARLSKEIMDGGFSASVFPYSIILFLKQDNGYRNIHPNIQQIATCAEILGCSVDYLIGLSDNRQGGISRD